MTIWLNGQPTETVAADDRGLTLGDGHFTTMLVNNAQVEYWPYHQRRLQWANQKLGFVQPDWQQLKDEIQQACSGSEQACLRLTLTRGRAGRGYQGQWQVAPTRIMTLSAFPVHYRAWQRRGIDAELADTTLATGGSLVGLKTLGRLEQVLLKQEAAERGVDELLVSDGQGHLIESSAGNVFLLDRHSQIITPSLNLCGIAGIMRARIIAHFQQLHSPVLERPIPLDELPYMQQAFISNALMGVVPLRRIGKLAFTERSAADSVLESLKLWR